MSETTDRANKIENQIIDLGNRVYEASVRFYERNENEGIIHGNGHHMAQSLSSRAQTLFINRLSKEDREMLPEFWNRKKP